MEINHPPGKILKDEESVESYKIEESGFVVCMVNKVCLTDCLCKSLNCISDIQRSPSQLPLLSPLPPPLLQLRQLNPLPALPPLLLLLHSRQTNRLHLPPLLLPTDPLRLPPRPRQLQLALPWVLREPKLLPVWKPWDLRGARLRPPCVPRSTTRIVL